VCEGAILGEVKALEVKIIVDIRCVAKEDNT
jgi:hypothetical protein